ncbi:hypothetical protein ACOTBZ_28645 [Achromobacter xylosoxidans]|uniref:hypothetical protein n=1 Tax=Achromobacter ruhlandii TaxID=72557 RepID=UPI001581C738|nr:hypothetical protein [Achromobacter ruhlandii]
MPYSATQLNRILHEVETRRPGDSTHVAEKLSEDEHGIVLRIAVGEKQSVLFRRHQSGVWEIVQNTPPNPLDYFAAEGTREALIKFLRDTNAAIQLEYPTDDINRIAHLVFRAYEDLKTGSAQVTEVAVVQRYRVLRTQRA